MVPRKMSDKTAEVLDDVTNSYVLRAIERLGTEVASLATEIECPSRGANHPAQKVRKRQDLLRLVAEIVRRSAELD